MIRPLHELRSDPGEAEIEIGHQLPMAAYHAAERWHPERIGALALCCSDGRGGEAFDEVSHRQPEMPRYDRWAVPGGPAWLAQPPDDPALKAARSQLDFLVKAHELERIVLITHFACAWYGHLLNQPAEACLAEQVGDVMTAAETLSGWYPGIAMQGFLAMRQREWLSFHPIELRRGARIA